MRIRGPSGVIATVCSKWADIEPSVVLIVQPSSMHEHVRAAGRDHGLDRDGHALGEPWPAARLAEVRDVRVLVVVAADPVADEAPDHGEAGAFDDGLHRVRDVPDAIVDDRLGDPRGERLLGDVEQPLILRLDLPDSERVRAVGDVAVERDPHVDRDEVALADDEGVRDPVDDDVVRRDADRLRVALVALGRRDAAVLANERAGGGVELVRRHARPKQSADVGDRLGDERTRRRHLLDLPRALADDHRLTPTPASASSTAAKTSSIVCSPSTATSVPVSR